MSFEKFMLDASLLQAVQDSGYEKPTPIQTQAIPLVLLGKDVMAGAQTGTGKTAAFALPILQAILANNSHALVAHDDPAIHQTYALILTPTRELAQQVYKSFQHYGQYTKVSFCVAYGGVSINHQIQSLKIGADIIVATPGRFLELLLKKLVRVDQLKTLVFDEADRMLDMGFMAEIERILKAVPKQRQTLLFSATFNDEIFSLSKKLLIDPTLIEVGNRNQAAADVEQRVYAISASRKRELISYLIGSNNWWQVLIFTRTKAGADDLSKELQKDGVEAQSIHGDKSQGARDRILTSFRDGRLRALVATDVAARGLDIPDLEQVINFELPFNAEDYVHRIGRTGRAGNKGLAITLVSPKESYLLRDVEEMLGEPLVQQWYPGYEPDLDEVEITTKKQKPGLSKKRAREKALGIKSKPKRR